MAAHNKKHRTILLFGTDHEVLLSRTKRLTQIGFHVLNSTNGFEAIQMGSLAVVDAVVLDQDRNTAEVELVAREIKRFRPRMPTILLAEACEPAVRTRELADTMIVRKEKVSTLVTALEEILAARSSENQAALEDQLL
jgi:DNA-binding NtrC family response regulator